MRKEGQEVSGPQREKGKVSIEIKFQAVVFARVVIAVEKTSC